MDYWTAVGEVYTVTLSLSFFILAFLMFYIGRRGYKLNNRYGGVSSILTGICFLIFGFYNSLVKFFIYPYNGFMVWWIGIILLVNFTFVMLIKRVKKKVSGTIENQAIGEGFNQLAKIHKSLTTSEERNLWDALPNLQSLQKRLGIPDAVAEDALRIYTQTVKKKLTMGRSIDTLLSASIFAALRVHGIPRTAEEITKVAQIPKKKVVESYRLILKEVLPKLSMKVQHFSDRKPLLERYVERMTKENPYREEITLKMEYIRKSFHLTGLLLVLAYFGLPFLYPVTRIISDGVIELINNLGPVYTSLWGDLSLFPFTIGDPSGLAVIYLTMMALIGALMFAIISDLIRIIWGPEYSIFNFLTKSMLRNKERNAAGPQIYIITGFVFSYMLFMVNLLNIRGVFSGILIACLSDAAAALIGRKYGKYKVTVRSKDTKSIEGFLAGVVVAYIIGLILVGPIYAIIGAVIFFITDYFPIYIADNLLNPIFIPIGIQLFIVLLGLPVGW
ncbi:MAG: hypothetical protein ACXAC5_09055 [Promethearchaeota archaeon]|jgi:dolichol kinase